MRVVLSDKASKLESELIAGADSLMSDTHMQNLGLQSLRKELSASGEHYPGVFKLCT